MENLSFKGYTVKSVIANLKEFKSFTLINNKEAEVCYLPLWTKLGKRSEWAEEDLPVRVKVIIEYEDVYDSKK